MKTTERASVQRVYAYLGTRTEINPDDVIDSYGSTELRVEDLRAVLAALRGAVEHGLTPEQRTHYAEVVDALGEDRADQIVRVVGGGALADALAMDLEASRR